MRASDFITEQPVPPKKPGTIAVTNMPVVNKNIGMKDQQMQKFKQQMQKDGGYQYTSQATKDAIARSDKRVQDAMRKQARVDAIGGAGASNIQRVKPVTFDPKNSASNVKIAMDDIQNAIREHVKQGIPFTECMFRAGSPAFTEFYRQVRAVREHLNLDWQDQELLDTDIGECIMVEGELVPLDVPMEELELDEAEYQGRKVKLNSPKRGGSKKFYVYVKNPKTGRVKKISWGDTTGLSVKAKDRGAVRSFVARHKCKQANNKMTARYWSCRTPRYKALGVKGGQWW